MTRGDRAKAAKRHGAPAAAPRAGAPPLPLRHPAMLAATVVAAACLLFSVTFPIQDPDLWQHLLVGKAIWTLHRVPHEHLWTWPRYGTPDVLPSWGFRALLWPFWAAAGVWGLFAWRWLWTLVTWALLWATARRMGARSFATLFVLVIAGLVWRARSEVRPETIVAPLLALELWLLERRRAGAARDASWAIVAIAWVWANVHISYYLGLVLIGVYALDERRRPRDPGAGPRVPLLIVGAAAAAISFVNPFGWRALWQPFEYFLVWRHEPIYRTIDELWPLSLSRHWRDGLPLFLFGWPMLIVWRARRSGLDLAETVICALFTGLVVSAERFSGFYAVVAAPFVSRDLGEWLGSRRGSRPAMAPASRAAIAGCACVLVGTFEWTRPAYRPGFGIDLGDLPVHACDFMEEHGVRGRGFNPYFQGGYLLWRFWPDRGRLPFMDVHQSGSREDRRLVVEVQEKEGPWRRLDRERHFDYVLLEAHPGAADERLLEEIDSDSTFALVFRDDAAALFVRRDGSSAAIAARLGYRRVPASDRRVNALLQSLVADSTARRETEAEAERMLRASPLDTRLHVVLANLALLDQRPDRARAHLRAALANPRLLGIHEQLGRLALNDGEAAEALREFEAERRRGRASPDLLVLISAARESLAVQRDLRASRGSSR